MSMPCRITQEKVPNPWGSDDTRVKCLACDELIEKGENLCSEICEEKRIHLEAKLPSYLAWLNRLMIQAAPKEHRALINKLYMEQSKVLLDSVKNEVAK